MLDREVGQLSGGELQRFAIAVVCVQKSDIIMFDEPSSYLDVKQRLNAAKVIRSKITPSGYIICVEHDLSVLDYLSDFICCLYGVPSVYGVVTLPFGVREGIFCVVSKYLYLISQESTSSWTETFPPRTSDSVKNHCSSRLPRLLKH